MRSFNSLIQESSTKELVNAKRILIVDDDDISFMLLDEILGSMAVVSERAMDGLEAVTIFEDDPEAFDLVLMDIRMPNLNGIEATRDIKQINPSVPIIAVTAYSNAQTIIDCSKAGCDKYITKPFEVAKLISTIETQLVLDQ